ncbi:MAG: DUF1259 domain-containing protein [Terriglobales bacterium]
MRQISRLLIFCALAAAAAVTQQTTASSDSAWKPVEQAMGHSGQVQPDGAMKFGLPRSDLKVVLRGVQIKPPLALGGWVAFSSSGHGMVMGDLVLTENEVAPVMSELEHSGIAVTALHNHLLHETPHVMYMHIAAQGDATTLAHGVHDAVALTKIPPAPAAPASATSKLEIDTAGIETALGHKGKINGGVFQVGVPRAEAITDAGMKVPNSLGVATGINFQPTGNGKAAIAGDFVLLPSEVGPVMKALRAGGIEVTAVHSHMLDESPRLIFMHYWANDDAVKLAKALRATLDLTNSAK